MSDRNTIVIESNIYKNKVKYLWKDDVNTLTDLSEQRKSPFSRSKPDYKRFSTGLLTEVAYDVVSAINKAYNEDGSGLDIEINGTEADYLAIKSAIEKDFSDRNMDCMWSGHVQSPEEIMPKIKNIYHELKTSLENCGQGIIELCDRYDDKGWLRSGFNKENIDDETALINLCAEAGRYLKNVMAEINQEADHNAEEISKLERELEQSQLQITEESPEVGAEIDIDKLSKIVKKICKKYTWEFGKEFEGLLEQSAEEKYLNENRIKKLVKSAEDYMDIHQIKWVKSTSRDNPDMQREDEVRRRECILEMLIDNLNNDIKQYVGEINSEGVKFGDNCIEKLKEKFCTKIYESKEFSDSQKETVRQWVYGGGSVNAPYYILKVEEQIAKDRFRWTRRTSEDFKENDICREYGRKLSKELNDKVKDAKDGNSKVFEAWGDAFFEMLKNQDSNNKSDRLNNVKRIEEKLKECLEKKGKLIILQNIFQVNRKKIDMLLSFGED